MQLISISLSNIVLILIFSIITFTIEQTTAYMRRKKTTRIMIFFKCINSVKLSLIESTCIFFSFMSFDCAMIFLSFNIVFIFPSMMLRNICLNNLKEISSNLRRRISINVFSIYLITSIEFDCSLMICVSFLNFFVISTILTKLNLISFVFLYLMTSEFELMLTKIFFIITSAQRTSVKKIFFIKNNFVCQIHCIRIISVANIFYRELNDFFYFRFFKTQANCFNEDFHEVLRTEKLFSCRAVRIFINNFLS